MKYIHRVEIDQSGKIGDTGVPTALAFSNGQQYAILIPAPVKRASIHALRGLGYADHSLYIHLFCTGLYLLLRSKTLTLTQIVIDIEYPGQNAIIKERLLQMLNKGDVRLRPDQIAFGLIHKAPGVPRAHVLAYKTYRGKLRPDRCSHKSSGAAAKAKQKRSRTPRGENLVRLTD